MPAVNAATFFEKLSAMRAGSGAFSRAAAAVAGAASLAQRGIDLTVTHRAQVFANSDVSLEYVDTYGFDHDYTLVSYLPKLEHQIYDIARDLLVSEHGYPPDMINKLSFDPNFVIRGLHYDTTNGLLFKLDQHAKIRPGTVYFGREAVPTHEVVEKYHGLKVPRSYIDSKLTMISDLFALPRGCLIADVIEVMKRADCDIHPYYVLKDVEAAINGAHSSGAIHKCVIDHPELYLQKSEAVGKLLVRLREAGKKTFLLSNSGLKFIDAGLSYMLSDFLKESGVASWRDLFNVVIVAARKPSWYSGTAGFRRVNVSTGQLEFERVQELKHGCVYTEGSMAEFQRLTGFTAEGTLYLGDHLFADLASPMKMATWKTLAVIREVEHEIDVMNSPAFLEALGRLEDVERLISMGQFIEDKAVRDSIVQLKLERKSLRTFTMNAINPYFGSAFRSYNTRTMYFYNVGRYADLYTSSLANLLDYPLDYAFISRRSFYPHESELLGYA